MGNQCGGEDDGGIVSQHSLRGNMMYTTQKRDVNDVYDVVQVIGEGSMGSISLIKKKAEYAGGSAYKGKKNAFGRRNSKAPDEVVAEAQKKQYALKSILLTKVSDDMMDELRNEIAVLQTLDHPNIVKELEVYETGINIYLVLELCSGGDLYTRGPYSEKDAAKLTGKLLSAIAHMHQHGITHRDLKYENVMFESREDDAEIKIIDFGLANKSVPGAGEEMSEGVGTMYTIAPEVLTGKYTTKVDLWSIGVMAYMLLSSTKPFNERRRSRMIAKIKQGSFSFDADVWETLSQLSKDFVSSLIVVDPNERPDALDASHHPWLKATLTLSDRALDCNVLDTVQTSIFDYGQTSDFKKMALMVIAHKSTSADIVDLRKAFMLYDTTNDGVLSLSEFRDAMNSTSKYSEEDITKMFKDIDTGKDGKIHYTEFLAATLESHGRIIEEKLADAFDRLDSDDTGYISHSNLRDFLGTDSTPEKVDQLMAEVDIDGDGKVTFEEFKTHFNSTQKEMSRQLEADA